LAAGARSGGNPAAGPSPSDASLVLRAGRGDTAAFGELVRRQLPAVLAIARRMLQDDAEAEDVAQEALLRLWHMAKGLGVGTAGVGPWLLRAASNFCIR